MPYCGTFCNCVGLREDFAAASIAKATQHASVDCDCFDCSVRALLWPAPAQAGKPRVAYPTLKALLIRAFGAMNMNLANRAESWLLGPEYSFSEPFPRLCR